MFCIFGGKIKKRILKALEVQEQEKSYMLCYAMKVWVFCILNWDPTNILKTVTVLNFCSWEKNHSGSIYILCSLIDIHTPDPYTSKQKSFFTSHALG